jgi:hypothetical protein
MYGIFKRLKMFYSILLERYRLILKRHNLAIKKIFIDFSNSNFEGTESELEIFGY